MSDNVIQYTTKEGQRWDSIALEMYGKASMMDKVIESNPDIPLEAILPGGTVLDIPIIEKIEVKTDAELLPPWMR